MKNLTEPDIDKFRLRTAAILREFGDFGGDTCGVFVLPSPVSRRPLRVVASRGGGWDHVSVSTEKRPPTWTEMEFVKLMFFDEDDCAMQLHVPPDEHINMHQNCLHLWMPNDGREIPRPPGWMVGYRQGKRMIPEGIK